MKTPKIILTLALFGFATSFVVAADAAANWTEHCSRCHAKDGSGNTKPGRKLKLKDYRDAAVQAEMSDEDILKYLVEGVTTDRGKAEMPSYSEKLTAEEREAMIPFIRTLKTS
jgi:cytochrome c6